MSTVTSAPLSGEGLPETLSPAIACDASHIPESLRTVAQWVNWKLLPNPNGPKPRKVPINPHTGREGKINDPSTWSSFQVAVDAMRTGSGLAGVGFVFTADDPFVGVDLDNCVQPNGEIVPVALEIIRQLNTYAEFSPSGTGVKLILAGKKPSGAKCKSKAIQGIGDVEIYDHRRFFALTGRLVPETPPTVEARQGELDDLCRRLWASGTIRTPVVSQADSPVGIDDELVLRKAARSKRFRRLWAGDMSIHDDDHSAADLALCRLLAHYSRRNRQQMDRLFRQSGLMRPKWDEVRCGDGRTYGQMTIDVVVQLSPDGCATIMIGQRDPASGRLVLSTQQTLPTAEAFLQERFHHPQGRLLHWYCGVLVHWKGNRFQPIEDASLKHDLQFWLHKALRLHRLRNGDTELVDFNSNPGTIGAALESIKTLTHLSALVRSPSWLADDAALPSAVEILPCSSCNIHLPTGTVTPATPALFTTNALEFDYQADAPPPSRWLAFLDQLWGDDIQSIELLQEWFGYCLIADTAQHKMLLLIGPRRAGKGTIARVLTRLVGAGNVVGPTIGSLARGFGLQSLIGKSLAIVSDARFAGDNLNIVIERLLCISGEDTITIERKYLPAVTMRLPTRFMFLTNELPRFTDSSTALAGRFLLLRLTKSHFGSEDPALSDRLCEELPGILVWAIEGWNRLRRRGRFVAPASSQALTQDLEDLASPVSAFVRECCTIASGHRTRVDEVFAAWRKWCELGGRNVVGTKQSFGRDLGAAFPAVIRRRGTDDIPFYEGLGLRDGDSMSEPTGAPQRTVTNRRDGADCAPPHAHVDSGALGEAAAARRTPQLQPSQRFVTVSDGEQQGGSP